MLLKIENGFDAFDLYHPCLTEDSQGFGQEYIFYYRQKAGIGFDYTLTLNQKPIGVEIHVYFLPLPNGNIDVTLEAFSTFEL